MLIIETFWKLRCANLVGVLALSIPLVGQDQWTLVRPKASPSGRFGAAMAFDSARNVVVLFGGSPAGSNLSSETWEWDGVNWTLRKPKVSPQQRQEHSMVYDSHRKVCVMVGGANLKDTWEWDGTNWALVDTGVGGVNPRRNSALAYDAARRLVVRFGGNAGAATGNTLTWNGKKWTEVTTNGPRPRMEHAMAYDPLRERVVLYGGFTGTVTLNDTWEWDGKVWIERKSKTRPPKRRLHRMVWMGKAGKVMIYGGYVGNNPLNPEETWAWNGVDWRKRTHVGNPLGKLKCSLAYDAKREQIVLFGGHSFPERWHETWLFSTKIQNPATFTAFGKGCKGTVGTASLQLHEGRLPYIGEELRMRISQLPKAAFNVPLGIFGASRTKFGAAKLPMSLTPWGLTGCDLNVSFDIPVILTNLGGESLWKQQLPYVVGLVGAKVYAQALVLDIGANRANLVMSNAAELRIGDR